MILEKIKQAVRRVQFRVRCAPGAFRPLGRRPPPCDHGRACAGSARSSIRPGRSASMRSREWWRHSATAGPTGRRCGASPRSRSSTPGSRSSTLPAATSRWTPRTGPSRRSSTGRSTTTPSCAPAWSERVTASRPGRTARWSCTPTRRAGPTSSRDLNGIFAFAVWDSRAKRLVAARDQFGVKPLYWWTRRPSRGAGLRDRRPAGGRPRRGGGGPGGARPLPRLPLRARPAHPLQGRAEAAARRRC